MVFQQRQGFATVGGDGDVAAQLAQHALGHQLVYRIVFHQQDTRLSFSARSPRAGTGLGGVNAMEDAP
ncbi:hypothetical protein D3C80_2099750 [compost metagenome]